MRLRVLVAVGCSLALVAPITTAQAATDGALLLQAQEQSAITKARATKLAKAGVLKKSDLPGYFAERESPEPGEQAEERALYSCLGAKVPKFLARNHGIVFTKGALEIDSSADVLTTVSKARADLKLQASRKMPRCIKERLVVVFEREGAEIESVSVKRVDVMVKGADAASAYRVTASIAINGSLLRLDAYALTALVGQTEIYLSPGGFNAPKPSFKQVVALARIAAKRVAAV